jgi:hypothetical protein
LCLGVSLNSRGPPTPRFSMDAALGQKIRKAKELGDMRVEEGNPVFSGMLTHWPLGLDLPELSFWEFLKLTPEELRQKLSAQQVAP